MNQKKEVVFAKLLKLVVLALMFVFLLAFAACGGSRDTEPNVGGGNVENQEATTGEATVPAETDTSAQQATAPSGEPTVIRIGHNWARELDPNFRDPITGEPGMGQEELSARIAAEERVLELHNVVFEWVQYPGDISEDLLRSVLANNPIADLVRITGQQGQLLGQNVLQPIDRWVNHFEGEDTSWMIPGQVYGHYFFMNTVLRFGSSAPLVYNVTRLQQVDALRGPDGNVVLPSDHWREGTWTWSVFEDYLDAVRNYWEQRWDGYHAFGAHVPMTTLMAIHSNGGALYGSDGFAGDSLEALEAVAFVERLIARGLIRSLDLIPGTGRINGLMDVWRFQWGHSMFANLQQWLAGDMVGHFNERGESIGIVPFPRPDHMAIDDPRYRQLSDAGDVYGVPRGISSEIAELALVAFRDYWAYFYRIMSGSDRVLDFLQSERAVRDAAIRMNLDITNPDFGQDMLDIWAFLGNNENVMINEFSRHVGIHELWSNDILSDSLFGVPGIPGYATHLVASMGQLNSIMDTIRNAIGGDAIIDNIAPRFITEGQNFVFPIGTNPSTVNWTEFITAEDNVDGVLNINDANIDYSGTDFTMVGVHHNAVVLSINDATGNKGQTTLTVLLYDPENTEPPSLNLHGELRDIPLGENTSDINWRGDFLWYAQDRDGLDISDSLWVDLSELDTTTQGTYEVAFTVTDFAGNSTTVVAEINVVWE